MLRKSQHFTAKTLAQTPPHQHRGCSVTHTDASAAPKTTSPWAPYGAGHGHGHPTRSLGATDGGVQRHRGGREGDVVGTASAGARRRLGEAALCPRSLIIKCRRPQPLGAPPALTEAVLGAPLPVPSAESLSGGAGCPAPL